MSTDLTNYIRAGYSVLYLQTTEESRAILDIVAGVKKLGENRTKRQIKTWSCTEGLAEPGQNQGGDPVHDDPVEALESLLPQDKPTVYIFRDLAPFFQVPKVRRLIRDLSTRFKQEQRTLIIIGAECQLPPDLERDIVLIEYQLPTKEELRVVFTKIYEPLKKKKQLSINEEEQDRIVEAALGLTTIEAENAMAKSIIEHIDMPTKDRKDNPISRLLMREKALTVKKSGILEYSEASEKTDDIGGLDNLKKWLDVRVRNAFTQKARDFGLPTPKGIVLVGPPGTGKSLTAKAASNLLQIPLIRFDVGKVLEGLVGSSERNMRNALATIDAVGNCIVFIDEMEKSWAGAGGSGENDSGTTRRIFGTFLTWMQEKKSASFIIATINDVSAIPAEMLRKGRFDEIFFVDLPTKRERKEIFKIQIAKHKRNPNKFALDDLAKKTSGFSGAEIEQVVIDGLYTAFHRNDELQYDYLWSAIERTVPLSKSRSDQIKMMTKWAKVHAVPASSEETTDAEELERSIDI